ncbi:MAG: ribosomal protein S18-alanine N-acetyltransferase [Lachnospiraceae bacterium]|nr:ribosomal protein S18-alanine N-acetyltransferase [Lachnospiraceae bacterium]MDD5852700.1 ribosomal protein S18-alanine N-acetyltransferase [Lachnospiraceae bacterium]
MLPDNEIMIRKMTMDDLDTVVEIEKECFSVPWSKQGFMDALQKTDAYYIVAVTDDRVVGYCGAYGVCDEADINQVAVTGNYRRSGIGERMVRQLLDGLKERGYLYTTLEVRKSNTAAIALYEKLGFVSEGIRKNFYEKPTEDAVIMWKR